jgi:hypothetical protein
MPSWVAVLLAIVKQIAAAWIAQVRLESALTKQGAADQERKSTQQAEAREASARQADADVTPGIETDGFRRD